VLQRTSKYNLCNLVVMNVLSDTKENIALSVKVMYRFTLHAFNMTSTTVLLTFNLNSVYTEAVTPIRHSFLFFYLWLSYLFPPHSISLSPFN
jgi:hypothetical protein